MRLGDNGIPLRYWEKVLPDPLKPDCLIWTGWTSGGGYGQIKVRGATVMAYRYFYEKIIGPIPEGMVPHHTCINPPCINPRHIELMTHARNVELNGSHPYRRNYNG